MQQLPVVATHESIVVLHNWTELHTLNEVRNGLLMNHGVAKAIHSLAPIKERVRTDESPQQRLPTEDCTFHRSTR